MKKVISIILLLGIVLMTGTATAVSWTDDLGRTVDIPENIQHVIPASNIAHITLSSFDPKYFVSRSMNFPDTAKQYFDKRILDLLNTGNLYKTESTMQDEQLMQMAKYRGVDIVLDIGENKEGLAEDLNKMEHVTGIPFVHITQDTIDSIPKSYRTLGRLLSEEERAKDLVTYIQSVIDRFRENINKIGDRKATYIYVTNINGNAIYMVGSGTKSANHLQVLDSAATNIAPEAISSRGRGDEYTKEDIFSLDPDIIIVDATGGHEYYNEILASPQWASLRAVQEGNVFENPVGNPWNWIGQPPSSFSKIISMIWIGSVIYPDIFNYNAKKEIQTFFKTMLNYDMSDDEVSNLTRYTLNKAEKPATASSPAPIIGILAGLATAVPIMRRRS
ncbi:MAG TPA: ABC transporter substrate-binding protein [Methanocorpusculum sp.]|nr:ABC transporter substrate-binding protein [Methanocorpusculum sp.]